MTARTLKEGTAEQLKILLASAVGSISDRLGSTLNQPVQVHPGQLSCQDPDDLLSTLAAPAVVARGCMDQDYEDRSMWTMIAVPDAVTMACALMMVPESAVAERRSATQLTKDEAEAFGEIANLIYAGFAETLSPKLENFGVRVREHARVERGADPDGVMGSARLVTMSFRIKIGEHPESTARIAVDAEVAAQWNSAPLVEQADEDRLENIPEAPIQGALAAYVNHVDLYRLLRLSCRRVGLSIRRHGRGEVPNPSAHRNEVLVLEMPLGEERRFSWCARVKELSPSTKVAIVLHHPSKQRVTQAFLAGADAILGFPCHERELSDKLGPLLAALGPAPCADGA